MPFQRQIPIGIEEGIARMVVPPVKRKKLFMGEFWDIFRVAARIIAVCSVRIKGVEKKTGHQLIRRGEGALHFIVYHALIGESGLARLVRIRFKRQTMALLLKAK